MSDGEPRGMEAVSDDSPEGCMRARKTLAAPLRMCEKDFPYGYPMPPVGDTGRDSKKYIRKFLDYQPRNESVAYDPTGCKQASARRIW